MPRDEALYWFQEGYYAGVTAERGRLRTEEAARRQRAVSHDLQRLIGVLAVALLDAGHSAASAAARRREQSKRGES